MTPLTRRTARRGPPRAHQLRNLLPATAAILLAVTSAFAIAPPPPAPSANSATSASASATSFISSAFPFPISIGSIRKGKIIFRDPSPPPPPPSPHKSPVVRKKQQKRPTQTCSASSLDGFTSSAELTSGLNLHWAVTSDDTMNLALEADSTTGAGWFGVGWSEDGSMFPANAVIANVDGGFVPQIANVVRGNPVDPYYMIGTATTDVEVTTRFDLGTAALDGTVATFQLTKGLGDPAFDPTGTMNVIYAYSAGGSKTLENHGSDHRGAITVDFSCDGTAAAPASAPASAPAPSPAEAPSATPTPSPPVAASPPPPAAPAAMGTACPTSTLSGYTYQVELSREYVLLHWKFKSDTVIDFAIEAKSATLVKNGWMAVGWSKKGKMKKSDAVIGNLPGVGAYYMSGYKTSNVVQTNGFDIGTTGVSSTTEGGTAVTFSRTVGTGTVPLKLNSTNYLIWAYSTTGSNTLSFHGTNQGAVKIDFSCYTVPLSMWGGGPDYSDDSSEDEKYGYGYGSYSANTASQPGAKTGADRHHKALYPHTNGNVQQQQQQQHGKKNHLNEAGKAGSRSSSSGGESNVQWLMRNMFGL